MRDACNPTDAELREWAYNPNATCPLEDWDSIIAEAGRAALYLELAEDLDCPNGGFFLSCLYVIVGDAVRASASHELQGILPVIDCAARSTVPEIRQWAEQSRLLMRHGSKFDWDAWYYRGEVTDLRRSPE